MQFISHPHLRTYVRSNSNQFRTKTASSCFKFLNVQFTTNVVHFFHHDTKPTLEQKQQRSTIHCKKVDRRISEYSRAKAQFFLEDFRDFGAHKKRSFQRNSFDSVSI